MATDQDILNALITLREEFRDKVPFVVEFDYPENENMELGL